MNVKSDKWIVEQCKKNKMIEPFVAEKCSKGVVSYGISSYGYDARIFNTFKVFTNVYSAVVDPKNMDSKCSL